MQLLAQNFVSCILINTMNFKKKKSKTIIVAVVRKNERRKTGVNICTHFNKNKKSIIKYTIYKNKLKFIISTRM